MTQSPQASSTTYCTSSTTSSHDTSRVVVLVWKESYNQSYDLPLKACTHICIATKFSTIRSPNVELISMARPSRGGRSAYDRVAATEEPIDDLESQTAPQANTIVDDTACTTTEGQEGETLTPEPNQEDDGDLITVVIMDPAQNKFEVSVNPLWNVGRLKKQGVTIHKIAVSQQRLIYMGRLLSDETILRDAKIDRDGVIIHLFPKPRVVIQSNNPESNDEETNTQSGGGGAHVPQIVLDPDEAQMRSQILVLGSAEILDAQNNVKLLSFLLLIITSMELLALFTIMLGVPQTVPDETGVDDTVQTDDTIHHHHHDEPDVRTWRNSDYFDLILNLFGFYAAMLGIKATTENTRRLALQYLICTVVCGVFWNAFYYYLNFEVEKEIDEERHKPGADGHPATTEPMLTTKDYLVQAFFAILIPMMIWFMCCMRAVQFYVLLEEAEQEAELRIQNEIRMVEEGNNADAEEAPAPASASGLLT